MNQLRVYNTLTRSKEVFEPLNAPFVGMYVCGPTVYGDGHLGHGRSAIVFDILFRYLIHLGYKVRYVRNITDVGHLVADADEGEDKIAKQARLEQLEPMEVAQRYTNSYHEVMDMLNVLRPSIEPRATGHIPEQIHMVQEILDNGYAYESNGSVYFDIEKYNADFPYGVISGRKIEDLQSGTRDLDGQAEKRNPLDFALWKKANPEHIMRWDSPWGEGFPGWHLECSCMSTKYLGETFDIHGGGMDLLFPHHDCEVAQVQASRKTQQARYWLHNNLITINGQKMGKSLGNFIPLMDFFSGGHDLLDRAYSPMTVRFFILQAHYRSTLDFSNEALTAAAKGYKKLMNGLKLVRTLEYSPEGEPDEKVQKQVSGIIDNVYRSMNDDLNTAQAIAQLFNLLKKINSIQTGNLQTGALGKELFDKMISTYQQFVDDVLGLREEKPAKPESLIDALIFLYRDAKEQKQYDKVDEIRSRLKEQGILLKDMKESVDWAYEEN